MLYFCYFSPAGPGMFARGGGVIYPRGPMETLDVMFKKGSHYEGTTTRSAYQSPTGYLRGQSSGSFINGFECGLRVPVPSDARRVNSVLKVYGSYLM